MFANKQTGLFARTFTCFAASLPVCRKALGTGAKKAVEGRGSRLKLLEAFGKVRYPVTANKSRLPPMLQREGYVRVKEAAEILDVAPNTVRAWGAAGKIGEYRHPANNYRLYKRKELEGLITKLRRTATHRRTPK